MLEPTNTNLDGDLTPKFSYSNIEDAFEYSFQSVTIHPDEIGCDVYLQLFQEKFYEYLRDVQ